MTKKAIIAKTMLAFADGTSLFRNILTVADIASNKSILCLGHGYTF